MNSIIKRELKAYFTSPLGYAIFAVMLFFSGLFFAALVANGQADMTYVFSSFMTVIFFVIPIITMRLFSEERRAKTDQLLYTSPTSITSIVFGKYLAALIYFSLFVGVMVLYNFVFYFFGAQPDMLIFLGNIVGIELFAGALIAIGIFISALTESQVVAAVGSFAVSFFLLLLDTISGFISNELITSVCSWISFSDRYYTFTSGIFDLTNVIFFLSFIAVFLFLTVRVIDRKRWA